MPAVVVDTHARLWYVYRSPRLSYRALAAIDEALSSGDGAYVSTISLVEMTYLVEKGTQPPEALRRIEAKLEDEAAGMKEVPVDLRISRALPRIPRASVPDMPDRIIAATALHLGLPLVTRDQRLQGTLVRTIW